MAGSVHGDDPLSILRLLLDCALDATMSEYSSSANRTRLGLDVMVRLSQLFLLGVPGAEEPPIAGRTAIRMLKQYIAKEPLFDTASSRTGESFATAMGTTRVLRPRSDFLHGKILRWGTRMLQRLLALTEAESQRRKVMGTKFQILVSVAEHVDGPEDSGAVKKVVSSPAKRLASARCTPAHMNRTMRRWRSVGCLNQGWPARMCPLIPRGHLAMCSQPAASLFTLISSRRFSLDQSLTHLQ
jgi:hypothetical protein